MKLRIDGVELDVPAILVDHNTAFYADHAGVVRSTRATYPPKSFDDMTPQEKVEAENASLRARLAALESPPPPPAEVEVPVA